MLKESLEKLDKDVMNLLTYSVKFVQPSIEFVSNSQGYEQKKKSTNSRQNKRKEGNMWVIPQVMVQEEDELLSPYSFAWLLTGDFRLAKGDVKRISFFHVNGRFVRYLNPFFATEAIPFFSFVYRRMRFLILGRPVGLKTVHGEKKEDGLRYEAV